MAERFLHKGNETAICMLRDGKLAAAKGKYPQLHPKVGGENRCITHDE